MVPVRVDELALALAAAEAAEQQDQRAAAARRADHALGRVHRREQALPLLDAACQGVGGRIACGRRHVCEVVAVVAVVYNEHGD